MAPSGSSAFTEGVFFEPTSSKRCSPLPRLKTISLVIRSTQGAEEVLKTHEEQLKEARAVPATLQELEATKASLKVPFGDLCFTWDRLSRGSVLK